jgi:hypothetical protein
LEACAHLVLDLGGHAAGDTQGEGVRDAVDDCGQILERVDKHGEDVENTRDELQHVGAVDDLVVQRVGPNVLRVHHVDLPMPSGAA